MWFYIIIQLYLNVILVAVLQFEGKIKTISVQKKASYPMQFMLFNF